MSDYFEEERYAELLHGLKEAAAKAEQVIAAMVFNCTLETRDGATLYMQIRGRPPRQITTPLRPRMSGNTFTKQESEFVFVPLQTREYELWSWSATTCTALYKEQ